MVQHLRSFATVDTFDQLPDPFTRDLHLQQAAGAASFFLTDN